MYPNLDNSLIKSIGETLSYCRLQTHTTAEDVNTDTKKDIPFGVAAQQTTFDDTYKDTASTQSYSFTNGVNAMDTSKFLYKIPN